MEQYLKKKSYFIEFLQRSCGDLKQRQALTAKNAENGLVINIGYHCERKKLDFSKPNCQRNANMLTSRADFSRNVQLKVRGRGVSASSIINEKHKTFEKAQEQNHLWWRRNSFLTLYTQTSVCIFSILFALHFP